jgi:hypothetical protein
LDNAIRVPEDLSISEKSALLSTIDMHDRLDGSALDGVIAYGQPHSSASNGYCVTVAKLLFIIGESTPYSILMSSGE